MFCGNQWTEKIDPAGQALYAWMKRSADEDGIVLAGRKRVAEALNLNPRTVANALHRLQARGKVYMLSYGQYVVVELVDLEENG